MSKHEPELADIGPRAIRVALSSVLVMVAAVAMLAGISESMISFAVPPDPRSDAAQGGSAVWWPGVGAALFAGLTFIGSICWLVWNLQAKPRAWWWLVAVVVVFGSFAVVFVVASSFAPSF